MVLAAQKNGYPEREEPLKHRGRLFGTSKNVASGRLSHMIVIILVIQQNSPRQQQSSGTIFLDKDMPTYFRTKYIFFN
jgi:hypothetical protein